MIYHHTQFETSPTFGDSRPPKKRKKEKKKRKFRDSELDEQQTYRKQRGSPTVTRSAKEGIIRTNSRPGSVIHPASLFCIFQWIQFFIPTTITTTKTTTTTTSPSRFVRLRHSLHHNIHSTVPFQQPTETSRLISAFTTPPTFWN